MDVPRYHSPTLVRRAFQITAVIWLAVVGYSLGTGDWRHMWWRPLYGLSLLEAVIVTEWQQRRVTRQAIDRLQARLANKRERRRAMKANKGASG